MGYFFLHAQKWSEYNDTKLGWQWHLISLGWYWTRLSLLDGARPRSLLAGGYEPPCRPFYTARNRVVCRDGRVGWMGGRAPGEDVPRVPKEREINLVNTHLGTIQDCTLSSRSKSAKLFHLHYVCHDPSHNLPEFCDNLDLSLLIKCFQWWLHVKEWMFKNDTPFQNHATKICTSDFHLLQSFWHFPFINPMKEQSSLL